MPAVKEIWYTPHLAIYNIRKRQKADYLQRKMSNIVFTWSDTAPQLVAALRGAHNRLWKQWLKNCFPASNGGRD